MYYKIQPEQIQIHAFSSPSGDLNFQAGSNFVYANLSRFLTGDFDITGSMKVNGVLVPVASPTNTVTGTNSFVFGGISNSISGERNVAVNANTCSVFGTGNSVVGAQSVTFSSTSQNNTALGGRGGNFSNVTGATILKDAVASVINANGNNSLTLSFVGGTFIDNGNLTLKNGDLHVGYLNSGLFSGNLNVLGIPYKAGVPLATTGDLGVTSGALSTRINNSGSLLMGASGILQTQITNSGSGLSTRINNSGSGLAARIDSADSFALALSGNAVLTTTNQPVSGVKSFAESQIFDQSIYIKGLSGILSGSSASTQVVPTSSSSTNGTRGLVAFSGDYFFIKISDAPHIWVRHSGSQSWP